MNCRKTIATSSICSTDFDFFCKGFNLNWWQLLWTPGKRLRILLTSGRLKLLEVFHEVRCKNINFGSPFLANSKLKLKLVNLVCPNLHCEATLHLSTYAFRFLIFDFWFSKYWERFKNSVRFFSLTKIQNLRSCVAKWWVVTLAVIHCEISTVRPVYSPYTGI